LFFAVRNTTHAAEHSNYLTSSPVSTYAFTGATGLGPAYTGWIGTRGIANFTPPGAGADPIVQTSLIYENTNRLAQMGSDYFSLVNPWYHAPVIPIDTGYHSYSYSLDFISLDPMGSTNYGKLTNVSIVPEASNQAQSANGQDDASQKIEGINFKQTYEFIVTAINNNIIRVSGGALGFPVL
jgi:hypothetical protein